MSRADESDWTLNPADIISRVQSISRENERLFQRLIAGEHRFRRLAKAVWKVQEEERRRLALELHDGIGQLLTALINQLQRTRDEGSLARLEESQKLAQSALSEVRRMSRMLRPPVLDDLGLEAAVRWLARMLKENTGLDVELVWRGDSERLGIETETLIFRTIQEALTNVVKHAGADRAQVDVRRAGDRLLVTIQDRGRGFDADKVMKGNEDPGFGLHGMRDRVALFGGKLRVQTAPGQGCTVSARIPLDEGET